MNKPFGWLARCVALSFRLYPRSYRREFEKEMRSVYTQAALEAEGSGILTWLRFLYRELRGVLAAVMSEYWQLAFYRGGRQMRTQDRSEGIAHNEQGSLPGESHSWTTLLAGSAIFLIWGLDAIRAEIAYPVGSPGFLTYVAVTRMLSWLVFLLPPAVVGFAWTRNFPRWTYPYVGAALLYAAFLDVIASPQFTIFGITVGGSNHWGWRAWIPLILALGIALLVSRSLRPFARFFTNAWDDWTLLSFAMFGWMPLFSLAGFDEIDSALTLIFIPMVVIVMVGTAMLYLASRRIRQRAWVLLVGAFLSLAITMIVSEIYWDGIQFLDAPRIVLVLAVFLGVMFSPGLIGVFRHFEQRGAPRRA